MNNCFQTQYRHVFNFQCPKIVYVFLTTLSSLVAHFGGDLLRGFAILEVLFLKEDKRESINENVAIMCTPLKKLKCTVPCSSFLLCGIKSPHDYDLEY